ncbi:MAG TPA: GAF domain-containing protein, partial [Anaerolineales bacterium]|nr:GAF domain-containing protein [Anaerolineales bacterium]
YPESAMLARQQFVQMADRWDQAQPGAAIFRFPQDRAASGDLRIFADHDPNYTDVIVTDRFGGLVAIVNPPRKYDQSAETWWRTAYNRGVGAIYISPPYFDESASIFVVTIAVPIFQPGPNDVIGVLHANYRLRNLIDNLADVQVGATGEAFLLTAEGKRIDTTASADIAAPSAEWADIVQSLTVSPQIGPFFGRESIIAVAPVSDLGSLRRINELNWRVAIVQDVDEGLAGARSIVLIGALISTAGGLILSLFAVNVARVLVRPIAGLTRTAREAQRGNLNVSAPVTSRDEVGELAESFNTMIGEIRSFTGLLETKVAERTDQLSAVNQIAATIAGSLDLGQVMAQTVNLIRDRLGYYHVSIFLLDEIGENAIVRESTGEIGRILKERPHRLAVGSQSIIGYVTANRQPRVALDTGVDAMHFKNPLLPDTRSEMALPLVVGDSLFGALDVQSVEPNAFDEQDVAVLQNMANQVAIAINNARLFAETRSRLDEISVLNRQYLARAWEAFSADNPAAVNLQLDGGLVNPAPDLSVHHQPISIAAPLLAQDGAAIMIPITLRDEVIGEFSLSAPLGTTRWTHDDLTLVEAVITQVALAVENARLLEETQAALAEANRLARRERIIADITNKITFGADVKRILQIAADELRHATGSSRAVVRLTGQPREAE